MRSLARKGVPSGVRGGDGGAHRDGEEEAGGNDQVKSPAGLGTAWVQERAGREGTQDARPASVGPPRGEPSSRAGFGPDPLMSSVWTPESGFHGPWVGVHLRLRPWRGNTERRQRSSWRGRRKTRLWGAAREGLQAGFLRKQARHLWGQVGMGGCQAGLLCKGCAVR